jgi:hypothetical protein
MGICNSYRTEELVRLFKKWKLLRSLYDTRKTCRDPSSPTMGKPWFFFFFFGVGGVGVIFTFELAPTICMYVKYLPFQIVGSSWLDFFLGSTYSSSKPLGEIS